MSERSSAISSSAFTSIVATRPAAARPAAARTKLLLEGRLRGVDDGGGVQGEGAVDIVNRVI